MKLHFHPEASQELIESAQYYEIKVEDLGVEFIDEVEKVLQLIETNPWLGTPFGETERRLLLNRFPYGIIYEIVEETHIKIYAVMHQHRKPVIGNIASRTVGYMAYNFITCAIFCNHLISCQNSSFHPYSV